MRFTIAGINVAISCQDSVTLQDYKPIYSSFLDNENKSANVDINIKIGINKLPDTSMQKKIFDSGQSWSMFMNNEDYFFIMNPHDSYKTPLWTARFDHAVQSVTISIGKKLVSRTNKMVTVPNLVSYPLDQVLLMYYLAQREGALLHAAGLCFHDRGYIFPGKSGAGKSTISRQLAELNEYNILSDDRIIIRKSNDTFKAFGTPWPGEAGIAINESAPLSGIFFISQASYNRIEEIKPQKALENLLPVVSIPWYDKEVMIKILDFCEDLISNVPVYELYFKPDIEVADVFEDFISKK
jgi:hypothetical protein